MALTQISTAGVKDNAVTAGKIPANAVGSSELADNSVDTNAIQDDAVTADKLANSINTSIAANTAKTSNATHTGDVTGSTSLTIANDAVTSVKIANDAVTSDKLASSSVGSDALGSQVVVTANIANNAVTAGKLASGVQTTINTNAALRVITGSDTANTLNGENDLYFYKSGDISVLEINGGSDNITSSGTVSSRLNFRCNDASVSINNGSRVGAAIETQDEASNGAFQALVFKTYQQTLSPNLTLREVARFRYNGDLKFITGAGIDFASATPSAGGSSNAVLDDYEEGTWTPKIKRYDSGSWSDATMTDNGTVQKARYVKVGRVITVYLHWNGWQQSNANYAVIGDLPFNASTNAGGFGMVTYTDAFTNDPTQGIYINGDSSLMSFYYESNAWNGWSSSSNRNIHLGVTYITA